MKRNSQLERAKVLARSVMSDERAQSGAAGGVDVVVGLTVAAIVAAFLIPVAIDQLVNVSTTNWSSGAASLWEILDLVVVLSVFLFMIGLALNQG